MVQSILDGISKIIEWLVTIAICYVSLSFLDNETWLAIMLGSIIHKLAYLSERKPSQEWVSPNSRMPMIGQRVLVKKASGATHYAIYSHHDEFDVHQPSRLPIDYREKWFKFSSATITA